MWNAESDESNSSSGSADEAVNEDSREPQSSNAPEPQEQEPDPIERPNEEVDEEASKGEADSDYENEDDKEYEDSEKSEEDNEGESSDSDSSEPKKKKAKKAGKIDDETRKFLESENYFRRSGRQRTEPKGETKKARRRRIDSDDEDDDESSESDTWSDEPRSRKRKAVAKKKEKVKKVARTNTGGRKKVDYKEDSSDEVDEEDVLEWKEEEVEEKAHSSTSSGGDTVEKVLKYRMGTVGATGPSTTCYNVEEKGDPNTGEATERQYLIKWVGWSHLHNTWESETSLANAGAKGMKKVTNFVKRLNDIEEWRRTADKEYIEYYECEQGMADELLEENKKVERVVAHQVSRDRKDDGEEQIEYLVKWMGVPYAECTWEDSRLVDREKIREYEDRTKNAKSPSKSAQVLRKRPKFLKLEEMPEELSKGGKQLRDYQLEGLNWMLHAWCKGNSCILADEMGLGKTIQSTCFLSSLSSIHNLHGPFLVVVPLSTMAAWQKELEKWATGLNVVTYMGDMASREFIRQYEWYAGGSKKLKVNICLTTYEILIKDKSFLGSIQWAVLAVDEAHRLKNDDSLLYKCLAAFHTDHRLLITGTPLQNSLKELWALLHFIMPEEFTSWEDFDNAHADTDHKGISSLHKKLEPFLLRRVKKDVEKSLPPKLEQILRVDMTREQKQFYKWILTKNYKELSKGVKGSINGFVNLVMELKKCCNHASLVRNYDETLYEPAAKLQQLLKSSGKLILLDKLLCRLRETGHRVLIFSQMVMMLDILQEYLKLRRFNAQRLDGSMRADLRKQALDHFNAEGSTDFCFLLSTRAGGLGINLATADTVIIFDSDWNPQNDLQAMSRAHRIGQTKTVNIYRLVTRGSVEEEIVERAKRKLVLDHLVIQRMDTTGRTVLHKSGGTNPGGTNSSLPFDKHELNDILKFGASELFKEADGEEQEPEVDIDMILQVAETRDAEEGQENQSDLLNAFKYANFAIDEEKDVALAGERNEWENIIPEDKRRKMEEEEREKELRELELGPRERKKVQEEPKVGKGGEEKDSEESDSDSGGRRKRKKAFGDFSNSEIKRFVRCVRKFARPLERLDAIAQEAELEEHGTGELEGLVKAFLAGCEGASKEYEEEGKKDTSEGGEEEKKKDKGAVFKFAGVVDVNVRSFAKMQNELEPLHLAMSIAEANGKLLTWRVPVQTRPQKGWNVVWTSEDDAALLRGIHKYGAGSWEAIKMDPALGLADKIYVKDKTKKPQPKHLQQRVDYLLKLLVKGKKEKKEVASRKSGVEKIREKKKQMMEKEKEKRKIGEKDKRREETRKEKKKEKTKRDSNGGQEGKSIGDLLTTVNINKATYASAIEDKEGKPFLECVSMMRPIHKYIKRLSSTDEKEVNKSVQRIGDHVQEEMEKLRKKRPSANIAKWYNYLWIFIAKFCSQEPADLLSLYRSLEKAHHKHKEKDRDHRNERSHKEHREHKEHRDHKDRDRNSREERDRKESHHSSNRSSHRPQLSNDFVDYRSPLKPPTTVSASVNGWGR